MSGLFSNITLSKYHLEKCPVFLSIQFSLHTSDKGKINRKKSTPMIIAVMIFLFLNSYDVPKIHINSSVESLFSLRLASNYPMNSAQTLLKFTFGLCCCCCPMLSKASMQLCYGKRLCSMQCRLCDLPNFSFGIFSYLSI